VVTPLTSWHRKFRRNTEGAGPTYINSDAYTGPFDTSLALGGVGIRVGDTVNERILNTFMHGPSTFIALEGQGGGGARGLVVINLGGEPASHQLLATEYESATLINAKLRCGIPGPSPSLYVQDCILVQTTGAGAGAGAGAGGSGGGTLGLFNLVTHSEPAGHYLTVQGGGTTIVRQYYSVALLQGAAVAADAAAVLDLQNVLFDKTKWVLDTEDGGQCPSFLATSHKGAAYWTVAGAVPTPIESGGGCE
jgi:hypothetical protein